MNEILRREVNDKKSEEVTSKINLNRNVIKRVNRDIIENDKNTTKTDKVLSEKKDDDNNKVVVSSKQPVVYKNESVNKEVEEPKKSIIKEDKPSVTTVIEGSNKIGPITAGKKDTGVVMDWREGRGVICFFCETGGGGRGCCFISETCSVATCFCTQPALGTALLTVFLSPLLLPYLLSLLKNPTLSNLV